MENIRLSEKYRKVLSFINNEIKPLVLLDEGIGDFFIDIYEIKDDYVKFNFTFGHDYYPFRTILYKNNKFFLGNNSTECKEMNSAFSKYL